MVNMSNFLRVVLSVDIFWSIAYSKDIQLPQGNRIGIDTLQQLQAAHGVAQNQKAQEDLFLSLPLVAPNQRSSITVANPSATVEATRKAQHRGNSSSVAPRADDNKFVSAFECDGPEDTIWREGWDPCYGHEEHPRFKPCLQPCMFTREWFLENTLLKPNNDECLFYTAGLSEAARVFAATHNEHTTKTGKIVTIWDIWDRNTWMLWSPRSINNPMRCVIQEDVPKDSGNRNHIRQRYFEGMSDAMAYMCGGKVAMMDRNIRKGRSGRVKQAGIWGRVEFPRLKMGAGDKWAPDGVPRIAQRVNAIGMNDQNVADTMVTWVNWWVRGGPDWPNEATKPFRKRSLEADNVGVNITEELEDLKTLHLIKRAGVDGFDSSVFDEGGAGEFDW